MHNYLLARR